MKDIKEDTWDLKVDLDTDITDKLQAAYENAVYALHEQATANKVNSEALRDIVEQLREVNMLLRGEK